MNNQDSLDKLLCEHQTLLDMKKHSPTGYKSLLIKLLEREEAIKQHEVDLTIFNLIQHNLFTPGDLARVVNETKAREDNQNA